MSDLLDLRDVSNYLIILGSDGIFSIRASKTSMEYKCTRLMGSLRTERYIYIYIYFPFYLRGREIVYGEGPGEASRLFIRVSGDFSVASVLL